MTELEYVERLLKTALAEIGRAKARAKARGDQAKASPDLHVPMPSDRDRVAQFIAEHCFAVPGAITRFTDFHEQFVKWVDGSWPKVRLSKALRELLPVGLMGANLLYVGNLSLEPASPGIPYRLVRDKLRQG